jgi:lipopolysaccharide/colanic/teichoic acid biosynthesis glycosyltransferase
VTPAAENVLALSKARRAHPLRALYRLEPLAGSILLIVCLPLLAVVCLVIVLLSRRTPLVRHRRVGWMGEDLPMLKIRSMWEPRQAWGPIFTIEDVSDSIPRDKTEDDERVTSRFAKWCRKFSIDELPQFYHVARGRMSMVGPRPITRSEMDEHYGLSSELVLTLKPGLTGLWQIKGRSRLNYSERKRLDVWLARHASVGLYFRILLRTVPCVILGRDSG